MTQEIPIRSLIDRIESDDPDLIYNESDYELAVELVESGRPVNEAFAEVTIRALERDPEIRELIPRILPDIEADGTAPMTELAKQLRERLASQKIRIVSRNPQRERKERGK